jgi:hypothetical protein
VDSLRIIDVIPFVGKDVRQPALQPRSDDLVVRCYKGRAGLALMTQASGGIEISGVDPGKPCLTTAAPSALGENRERVG